VISGASSGIGRASFEMLAREGATKSFGTARRAEKLEEALKAVEDAGGEGTIRSRRPRGRGDRRLR